MALAATLVCWGVVIIAWIVGAAYGARSRGHRQGGASGPLWRIGAVIAAVLAFHLGRHELHRVTDHSPWIEIPGLVLLLVSTGFTIWARVSLGRMWSASPDVLQTHHELRTDGPYAVTRHPIYTGLFGMLVGTVLLNGLGAALALLVVGGVVMATRIRIEERLMSKTFPAEYAHYRKRVPGFVPGMQLVRRSHRAI
jgi:protein-S-isoprenylcysteine O-methyltransferase Ste14